MGPLFLPRRKARTKTCGMVGALAPTPPRKRQRYTESTLCPRTNKPPPEIDAHQQRVSSLGVHILNLERGSAGRCEAGGLRYDILFCCFVWVVRI